MIYFHLVRTSFFLNVVYLVVNSHIFALLLHLAHHNTPYLTSAADVSTSTGT